MKQSEQGALTKGLASNEREGNGASNGHSLAGRPVRRGRELERASGTHQLESAVRQEGKLSKQVALTGWKAGQERVENGVSKGHLLAGRQVRRGRELEQVSGTHQLESA